VPQGSVLGPVFFLLYINDLMDNLECPALLFADDANIYSVIKSPEDVETIRKDMIQYKNGVRNGNLNLMKISVQQCM